jgi:hypothetical protein
VAPKGAERAHMATSEVGEMATLKPTDRARPEGARTSSEPTDMAAKTAAGSRDEITSDPTSHMTETPAVTSASSTPRRRDVRRRSGQGNRKGKGDDRAPRRTPGVSARHWRPPRELQRHIRDPAVSKHGSLLCGSDETAATRR